MAPPETLASYCSSPAWGGLEMHVVQQLDWMRQRGWRVILYGRPDTQMCRRASELGLATRPTAARRSVGDLAAAWRLARQTRQDGVRWLIVHQSRDLFLGAAAKTVAGARLKLLYNQHMHMGKNKKDPYHRWLYGRLDAFVTPVPWLAERVREKTTIARERIHVVPRGVELAPFVDHKPDRAAARQKLGLPPDAFLIGVIGRLDPKKGQHVAIRALRRVHDTGHPAHLLLVGAQTHDEGDAYVREIHRLVQDLNLSEFVHFRSHVDQPQWAYAALDLFVLASKSECYGMVTVEAMVSGLPVIGTNDGGTVSLIDHGRNGLLVTPLDHDELARAIIALIDDPATAQRLARTAREEGLVRFSRTTQCEAWEKLLVSLN